MSYSPWSWLKLLFSSLSFVLFFSSCLFVLTFCHFIFCRKSHTLLSTVTIHTSFFSLAPWFDDSTSCYPFSCVHIPSYECQTLLVHLSSAFLNIFISPIFIYIHPMLFFNKSLLVYQFHHIFCTNLISSIHHQISHLPPSRGDQEFHLLPPHIIFTCNNLSFEVLSVSKHSSKTHWSIPFTHIYLHMHLLGHVFPIIIPLTVHNERFPFTFLFSNYTLDCHIAHVCIQNPLHQNYKSTHSPPTKFLCVLSPLM